MAVRISKYQNALGKTREDICNSIISDKWDKLLTSRISSLLTTHQGVKTLGQSKDERAKSSSEEVPPGALKQLYLPSFYITLKLLVPDVTVDISGCLILVLL
jgi:hypothetical protein